MHDRDPSPDEAPSISAVILARDDSTRITRAVAEALRVVDEVVVVDGGSDDDTAALARRAGARVITVPLDRAAQLNAGVRACSTDHALLLDLDATLPSDAGAALRAPLADPSLVAASVGVRFEPDTWRARAVAWSLNRAASVGVGASSTLLVRRETFEAVGGLRASQVLSRRDLLRRLRDRGRVEHLAQVSLSVSARRLPRTPLRALLRWTLLRALDALGLAPRATAR